MKSLPRIVSHAAGWVWLPAAALVLLLVLGWLQFQWLSQLSEREHEARQNRLVADTQRFVEEFDGELERTYHAFQLSGESIERRDAQDALHRYELWKTQTVHDRLIRDIWIAELMSTASQPTTQHSAPLPLSSMPAEMTHSTWKFSHVDPEQRALIERPVPAELEPLRQRLMLDASPAVAHAGRPYNPYWHPIDEQTLSIIVPIPQRSFVMPLRPATLASGTIMVTGSVHSPPGMRFAILRLDRNYLQREWLPALATKYFATASAIDDGFGVVIVRRTAPHTLIYASHPDAYSNARIATDASAPLLAIRSTSVPERKTSSQRSVAGTIGNGSELAHWRLLVTHRAGSLVALANRTRLQNLLASSSLIALLAGSLVIILVALRRARALTRQQMEFVAGVSHELRTPVAVVCMTGANLADGLVIAPDQARLYGKIIQREGRRLKEMTEQVLSFARMESWTPAARLVAIEPLIHTVVESMEAQLKEASCHCAVAIEAALPLAYVEDASIERVLLNLISNAIKYRREPGEIRISAGKSRHPLGIWIAVADRGIGIDPEELPFIFEPFRRGRAALERNLPGTGLGLSLVQRIVRAHGGQVRVHSEPDVGSTFTVHLPVATGAGSGSTTR